jgi:serine/threonine-protein kinase
VQGRLPRPTLFGLYSAYGQLHPARVSSIDDYVTARTLLADRYALDREIGRGGMATVYLAEETKHSRQVAIKVLRPELAATLGAERFLREIGIAARLSHPHLVPLIDSGDAGGLLYYVSAYMPGGSLRERLQREGKLPVRDALRIAEEVSTALDYAHRAGFVHRDVKPENIPVRRRHALLADFGVARVCFGDGRRRGDRRGLAIGTPEYMSPEQASGERDDRRRARHLRARLRRVRDADGRSAVPRRDTRDHGRQVTETPPRTALHPEIPGGR